MMNDSILFFTTYLVFSVVFHFSINLVSDVSLTQAIQCDNLMRNVRVHIEVFNNIDFLLRT